MRLLCLSMPKKMKARQTFVDGSSIPGQEVSEQSL